MSQFPEVELVDGYTVKNGRIVGPGKFEGERRYIPYFYEAVLNGEGEDIGEEVSAVTVSSEDKARFPELKRRKRVKLWFRTDGFVVEVG